jgi:hypothetical protein
MRYVSALNADGAHPTHQLLRTNFRLGELYGYESATAHPFSMGWTKPERTHQLLGSRLAQQVTKHIEYDEEYGFDLSFRQDPPDSASVTRTHGYSRMPVRMLPGYLQQTTLFVKTAKEVSFGVGAAWKARDGWKSKSMQLGKCFTEADSASFAISMVLEDLPVALSKTDHRTAEIVTKSRLALAGLRIHTFVYCG